MQITWQVYSLKCFHFDEQLGRMVKKYSEKDCKPNELYCKVK